MKILIIVDTYSMGGAEAHALKFAKSICNEHEVQFWVFRVGDGTTKEICKEIGIETKIITEFSGFQKGFNLLRQIHHYRKIIKPFSPDAILSFNYLPNIWNGFFGKYAGVKCRIWSQQSEFNEEIPDRNYVRALKGISTFISNAHHVSSKLQTRLPIKLPKKNFTVIHNGISTQNTTHHENWNSRLNLNQFSVIVTMVANLTSNKDHLTLINSWKIVLDNITSVKKPLLVLAGRKGDTTEKIVSLINKLNIKEHIKLLGNVIDVQGLNQVSDIGVLSSKAEGLPNSIMEQMSIGLPVAGTYTDGIIEAVGENNIQYLSPKNDFRDLANKLLFLINRKDVRHMLGIENKLRIQQHFSLTKMSNSTLNIIRQNIN